MTVLHAMLSLYFSRNRDTNLKGLAWEMGITTAAITSVADSLEHLGLGKREDHGTDRRQTLISPTPKGEVFRRRVSEHLKALKMLLTARFPRKCKLSRCVSARGPQSS